MSVWIAAAKLREKQTTICAEEREDSYTSRDSSLSKILASKRGVCLPEQVLIVKRQPGVQMDLNSSELPDVIKTIVKKIVYYDKTAIIPGNNVLEMHDIKMIKISHFKKFCSVLNTNLIFFTSFIYSEKKSKNIVCIINLFSNVRSNSSSWWTWRNKSNRVCL